MPHNASAKIATVLLRLALLALLMALPADAFALDLFPHQSPPKTESQPPEKKSSANRAQRLQQEVMDFSDRFVMGTLASQREGETPQRSLRRSLSDEQISRINPRPL